MRQKKIFKEIMMGSFPGFGKGVYVQVQEAQQLKAEWGKNRKAHVGPSESHS